GRSLDGDVRVALSGAQVKTPALELLGGAQATAKLRASGGGDTIDATIDLGGARLLVPGAVDKAAGVPTRIAASIERAGDRVTVREATVDAPGADLRVAGYSDGKARKMDMQVSRCDIDLARLAQMAPMLRDKDALPPWLADGKIHLAAGIVGDPSHADAVH